MNTVHLSCPVDPAALRDLNLGDLVYLDGVIFTEREPDHIRDEVLARKGFRLLRFENDRVIKDLAAVHGEIRLALDNERPPHPALRDRLPARGCAPSPAGEGDGG